MATKRAKPHKKPVEPTEQEVTAWVRLHIERRFEQVWRANRDLLDAIRHLTDAQRINTDKLNLLVGYAEDAQKARHQHQEDEMQGLTLLEDDLGEEWTAPWA